MSLSKQFNPDYIKIKLREYGRLFFDTARGKLDNEKAAQQEEIQEAKRKVNRAEDRLEKAIEE